ncbi:MAG: hypothetical protein ACRDKG_04780 [Actinomycetota bacterium]
MRRSPLSLAFVAFVLIATATAFAATNSAEPPPPEYPITNVLNDFQNPQRSITDPAIGRYNFEAGIYGAARRAVQKYPEHYLTTGVDVRHEIQVALDSLLHIRPTIPYSHIGDAGHPALMPDWDHDGVFGDSGGLGVNDRGDFDADTDEVEDTAFFRIPCYTPDDEWQVHHRYADGTCDITDAGAQPYKIGIARELRIINARGLVLDATLMFPATAFTGQACPMFGTAAYADASAWESCVSPANLATTGSFPGVVFANGLASRQEHYAWLTMRMVDEGYVVLTYDPAGQAESEGTFLDLVGATDAQRADPTFGGAIRDVQDAMRWFVGQAITPVADNGPRLVPRANPADNIANPAAGALDEVHIALAGNSMGAISTLAYLNLLGSPGGLGSDGRPLPKPLAAVPLSGAHPTHAVVPTQLQTSDGDGSITLTGPKVAGVTLGFGTQGIGYEPMKAMYDQLRATSDPAPLSFVVLESGSHTDHVNVPFVPRTFWANALAADYAADWINCYVLGDTPACAASVTPRPHLSRIYASEADTDGPAGAGPSRCITIPDAWSLNQGPAEIVAGLQGSPRYNCTP